MVCRSKRLVGWDAGVLLFLLLSMIHRTQGGASKVQEWKERVQEEVGGGTVPFGAPQTTHMPSSLHSKQALVITGMSRDERLRF